MVLANNEMVTITLILAAAGWTTIIFTGVFATIFCAFSLARPKRLSGAIRAEKG